MQAEPFSGAAMPLEVEAVAADPVETGEGRVKLFAEILRETGAVALNEAILGAVPLAGDIDRKLNCVGRMMGRKRGFRKSSIRCWQAAVTADFSAAEKPLDLMCPLGSRRFGTAWHGLSPVPGQKLIQPVDSVVIDAHKHVGEPGLRIDVVELGGHDQGRHDRGTLGTAI